MNTKLNPISRATKAMSLLDAVIIVVGLQGTLLWQFNEVANSSSQSAVLAARTSAPATSPAQAALASTRRLTLEPVTIVAHRESKISELRVAAVNKKAASSVVDKTINAMLGGQKPVNLY